MAKAKEKVEKGARVLICSVSGVEFTYSGRGRPPKYCPEVKAKLLKQQQDKAREKQASKKKASKKKAVASDLQATA